MALKKTVTNEIGITSVYHRIADIQQNFINAEGILTIYVYHYAGADYRDIEKERIATDIDFQAICGTSRYTLPVNDSLGCTRADIYNRLKTEVDIFEDAEDI